MSDPHGSVVGASASSVWIYEPVAQNPTSSRLFHRPRFPRYHRVRVITSHAAALRAASLILAL